MYSRFYFFNITNSRQVLNGAKPILNQVGPFTFLKKLSRNVIGYNDDHEELTFITKNTFTFLPELSDQDAWNKTIYTMNIPMVVSKCIFI